MSEPHSRILIVEDEATIRRFVRLALESAGHEIHEAEGVRRGLIEAGTRRPDLIVLDLGLPDGDGIDLIRDLRQWSSMPVIVLSARSREADKIAALDAGADDYLVKPYDPEELLARLRAIERRRHQDAAGARVVRGQVHIDLAREMVQVAGLPVVLTPKEWALLRVLASRPAQIFTRERLQEALYQWDASSDSNTLEVFISRLRRKLGSNLIQTVRGTGYRLEPV